MPRTMSRRHIPLLMFGAALVACAPMAPPREPACLFSSQAPMIEVALFFGRDIAGRAPLTDAEWTAFAADALVRAFPDGFTVLDGNGQWRDPRSGAVLRESTKIVLVAAPRTGDLAARIAAAASAYKTQFRQQSVGVVTREVCASF